MPGMRIQDLLLHGRTRALISPESIEELRATGQFESMSIKADEAEHSIEMHLPYVRRIFTGYLQDIKIIPIVVGAISKEVEASFGALLAPYLDREDTFCVVSSDFCHWGTRFSYTYYYPQPSPSETPAIKLSRSTAPTSAHPIHQSIRQLDHEAMDLLTLPPHSAGAAHEAFAAYLAKTKNTICGRHPIGVLLGAMTALENTKTIQPTVKWVSYASAWIQF
ncbi:hypothetical protein H0H87_003860 [Tephrocybe sp. NHM501043]|nr:hypothetical protein H0H87_003860 [Tephrocybe sp. NHM501043]